MDLIKTIEQEEINPPTAKQFLAIPENATPRWRLPLSPPGADRQPGASPFRDYGAASGCRTGGLARRQPAMPSISHPRVASWARRCGSAQMSGRRSVA